MKGPSLLSMFSSQTHWLLFICMYRVNVEQHPCIASNILSIRVELIHRLHRFFIPRVIRPLASVILYANSDTIRDNLHRKYNPTTKEQPAQPRQRPRPQRQYTLVLKNTRSTLKTIIVVFLRIDALHPCLNGIEWLCRVSACISASKNSNFEQPMLSVTYTVMNPALPPSANVLSVPSFSPGAT